MTSLIKNENKYHIFDNLFLTMKSTILIFIKEDIYNIFSFYINSNKMFAQIKINSYYSKIIFNKVIISTVKSILLNFSINMFK